METLSTLASTNLNLLIALDALLHEQHVTRAAHRIGVTQSAMSQSLSQLRVIFGDGLLTRGRGGMVATPLAAELRPAVRRVLTEIDRLLTQGPRFEPSTSRRCFRIAGADAVALVVAPRVQQVMQSTAPRATLEVLAKRWQRFGESLETGELDLVIDVQMPDRHGLRKESLVSLDFAAIMRRDHPAAREEPLTLETYLATPHVLVETGVGRVRSVVDMVLERTGHTRHVALRIGYFLAAVHVVAGTDLIWNAPSFLGRLYAQSLPIVYRKPPLDLPHFTLDMCWHDRFDEDPAHEWFRGVVRDGLRHTMAELGVNMLTASA